MRFIFNKKATEKYNLWNPYILFTVKKSNVAVKKKNKKNVKEQTQRLLSAQFKRARYWKQISISVTLVYDPMGWWAHQWQGMKGHSFVVKQLIQSLSLFFSWHVTFACRIRFGIQSRERNLQSSFWIFHVPSVCPFDRSEYPLFFLPFVWLASNRNKEKQKI